MLCCKTPAQRNVVSSYTNSEYDLRPIRRRKQKPARGFPKDYADVNAGKALYDFEKKDLKWGKFCYKVHYEKRLGEGAYGEVFLATNMDTGEDCVVKTIKPEKADMERIRKEVWMLKCVQNNTNIVKFVDQVKDPRSDVMMLVFEYIDNPDFRDTFANLTSKRAEFYLYSLLSALDYTHSRGIVHRDVKEANVLFNPGKHQVRLIDWGFATFFERGVPNDKWPGTRFFKAPELFLHYDYYDYAVDIWAYACVLGSTILQRAPLFRGREDDNGGQMQAIGKFLGTDDYRKYLAKYDFPEEYREKYTVETLKAERCKRTRINWEILVNKKNRHLASPEALDLLDKLLRWDHEERLTSREALMHPYFDRIRKGNGIYSESSSSESSS